jgi:hypothetical protein
MKTYVGCKLIKAKPMTRGAYNKKRGWEVPKDENPKDEGYVVKYPDGYVSWSPKEVFEKAYSEVRDNCSMFNITFIPSRDYVLVVGRT